jgi:hypothetical protein
MPDVVGTERLEFLPGVARQLRHYVYALRDPRDRVVFYVGKGVGNRAYQHARLALRGKGAGNLKLDRIRDIHRDGREVEVEIVRWGLSDEVTAFQVEAVVIDALTLGLPAALTNPIAGHGQRWSSLEQLRPLSAPRVDIAPEHLPAMLIRPRKKYAEQGGYGMTADELWEITRGGWPMKRRDYRFAFCVHEGIIRGVFRVTGWDADESRWGKGRRGFEGEPALDLWSRYVGGDVRHLLPARGGQLPFTPILAPAVARAAAPSRQRGRVNSSITRVRPIFSALLDRDPTGETWLPDLLQLAPFRSRLPPDLLRDPGLLRPDTAKPRTYHDKILGAIELPRCFEYRCDPPIAFLRWLVCNPEQLSRPAYIGKGEALLRRQALLGRDPAAREAAQQEALERLSAGGARGAARKWWAFEGPTEVDCLLETDRLRLLIEGKRTEPLSSATAWYPARNQLVRNLEVANELSTDKPAFVLLATEVPIPDLIRSDVESSTPHLTKADRGAIEGRYLGQVTWAAIRRAFGIDQTA